DLTVTGVQTCALPISGPGTFLAVLDRLLPVFDPVHAVAEDVPGPIDVLAPVPVALLQQVPRFVSQFRSRSTAARRPLRRFQPLEIGRAACRERGQSCV